MSVVRVSCLQLASPREGRPLAAHVDEAVDMVRASRGADLIVLPEMWHVGYFGFDQYEREAVTLGESELPRRFSALAAELGATIHMGSVVERDGGLFNTSLVFAPDGREVGRYRKIHVFGYGSREQELLTGGDEVATFPVAGLSAGMATCYDLRFPELFRAMVDDVALYVVPAAWPATRVEHWRSLLVARAIENQAFVIGCNAAGLDRGVALGGNSVIVSPYGEVIARAGTEPARLDAEVDLAEVAALRSSFRVLEDRTFDPPGRRGASAAAPAPGGS